jgi:hypothetical protein
MIASANSASCARAAGLIGLAAMLCSLPAFATDLAQADQPVDLLPSTLGTEAPAMPEEPVLPTTDDASAPAGFEVETLEDVGTDYVGTLEADTGGLGIDMWRGSDRARLDRLLPRLQPVVSPGLADLKRRLLLSAARAPAGPPGGRNLVAVRADLLARMGYPAEALELLRLQPARQRDAESARAISDLSWRTYDLVGGCENAAAAAAQFGADVYWQQSQVFCQILAGKTAEAALGLDLLREDASTDALYYRLADAVAGVNADPIAELPVVNPLYLAMLRSASQPIPADVARTVPSTEYPLIAESDNADPAVRLAMGETAAAAGVLAPEALAAIYAAQPFDAGDVDTVLDIPEAGDTPETRAMLYQAAGRGALPQIRAQYLQRALPSALRSPEDWVRLRLFEPALMELSPAAEMVGFAPDAARALYALGRFDLARDWLGIVEQSPEWRNSGVIWPSLLAFDHLAGGSRPVPLLELLLDAPDQNSTPSGDRAARLQAIFDAFDSSLDLAEVSVEGAVVASTSDALEMPERNLNLWLDLGDAANSGRLGETVLLTLIGLQSEALEQLEPAWIKRVLRSLQRVGLDQEARALAIEIAIANGL